MLPKSEFIAIALDHAKAGAKRLFNGAIPVLRIGYEVDLIGIFIPASAYYAFDKIESMTTYQMRDSGIFNDEEMRVLNEIDKVAILDDDEWINALEKKTKDELETDY